MQIVPRTPCGGSARDVDSMRRVRARCGLHVEGQHEMWTPCGGSARDVDSMWRVSTRCGLHEEGQGEMWLTCRLYHVAPSEAGYPCPAQKYLSQHCEQARQRGPLVRCIRRHYKDKRTWQGKWASGVTGLESWIEALVQHHTPHLDEDTSSR